MLEKAMLQEPNIGYVKSPGPIPWIARTFWKESGRAQAPRSHYSRLGGLVTAPGNRTTVAWAWPPPSSGPGQRPSDSRRPKLGAPKTWQVRKCYTINLFNGCAPALLAGSRNRHSRSRQGTPSAPSGRASSPACQPHQVEAPCEPRKHREGSSRGGRVVASSSWWSSAKTRQRP